LKLRKLLAQWHINNDGQKICCIGEMVCNKRPFRPYFFGKDMEEEKEKLEAVCRILSKADSILFITGAGISADSGLPTYRGIGGLYNNRHTDDDIPIEDALSGKMLSTSPAIAWKYISQIERACRGATFNRGHEVIAQMEQTFPRVWVLTQNVDGFHYQAGSKNVIDIHGNIHHLKCTICTYQFTVADYNGLAIPPLCSQCGAVLRPMVVLFGEMLPEEKYWRLAKELEQGFDVVFSIGTTSVFPYIAGPVLEAKRRGWPVIEINPAQTQVSHLADIKFAASAAKTLDAIWTKFQSPSKSSSS
jgi:NAD-dependent deacetylase